MEIIFCYFTLLIARYNTKTCSTKKVLTVVAIPVVGKIVSLLQLKTGEKTLNQPNKIALEDQFVSIQVFQKFLNVSFPLWNILIQCHLAHLLNHLNYIRPQPQYIQCYHDNAAINGKYTTINVMSGQQISAAIADDGILEYCFAGGWWEVGLEAVADILCQWSVRPEFFLRHYPFFTG